MNSWKELCGPCDKRCCMAGNPIIYPGEKKRIIEATGKEEFFEDFEGYSILRGHPCPFLKDGVCEIQDIKPLDCQTYPILIKPTSDGYEWMVDKECPAHSKLSVEFIAKAKKLFLSLTPKQREFDWKVASNDAGFKPVKLE